MSLKAFVVTSRSSIVNGSDGGGCGAASTRSGGSENPSIGGSIATFFSSTRPSRSFWRMRNRIDEGRSCVTRNVLERSGSSS